MFNEYTIVAVMAGGRALPDMVIVATGTKEAYSEAWRRLSEYERNVCESMECVELKENLPASDPRTWSAGDSRG